jgi:hypothetical protein
MHFFKFMRNPKNTTQIVVAIHRKEGQESDTCAGAELPLAVDMHFSPHVF